jgi:hypothetical protein
MGLQPEIQTPGSLPQDHNSGSYEAPVGSSQMQQPVSYSIPRSQGEDTNQVDNTRSRPVELGLQTENDAAPMEVFVRKIDDSEGQTVKTVSHEPMQVETANFNSPDPRRKNQKNGFQVFSKSKQENESGFISNPYASQGQGQTR